MKKLSKIVALLLAGALTMLMFTACGGGGGGSFGQRMPEEEKKAFGEFAAVQASGLRENDRSLQAVAEGYLQKDLNSRFDFLGAKLVCKVHVDGKDQEYLTITMTARYDYGFIVTKILTEIQEEVGKELPGANVNVNGKDSWTNLGVVVRSDGNHSYIAVAFKIKNPNK